jgi:hypothetical protein
MLASRIRWKLTGFWLFALTQKSVRGVESGEDESLDLCEGFSLHGCMVLPTARQAAVLSRSSLFVAYRKTEEENKEC